MNKERIFFNSETDQILFYLACLDGKTRMDKLKVTEFMYRNKNYAKKWYQEKRVIIEKDKTHVYYNKALKKLNEIYYNMTDY